MAESLGMYFELKEAPLVLRSIIYGVEDGQPRPVIRISCKLDKTAAGRLWKISKLRPNSALSATTYYNEVFPEKDLADFLSAVVDPLEKVLVLPQIVEPWTQLLAAMALATQECQAEAEPPFLTKLELLAKSYDQMML